MKHDDNILLQQATDAIRDISCPKQVDVTDAVMARLQHTQLLAPRQSRSLWLRGSIAAAACLLLGIGINLTILFTRSYDESSISNMISELNTFNDEYISANNIMMVEEMASDYFDYEEGAEETDLEY